MGTFFYLLEVINTQYLELLTDRLTAFDMWCGGLSARVSVCALASSPHLGTACLVVSGLAVPEVSFGPEMLWLFSLAGGHTPSHVVQSNCEGSAFCAVVL